ncbi:MAG: glycine cleavage system protein GcvH [Planctomycetales bacterium]|nr:glycine cleavage system protein GcvH [Planctomycetales bacterium]
MKPEELLYAKTHEWASIQDDQGHKIATVGISAFAVEQLTDLVFLEPPSVGQNVESGKSMGEIESVKAVSDVYSPVTGEVIEVNAELPDNLERLNDDPYNAGWIAKVKVTDESSLDALMDFAAYQKQCAEEQ